MTTGIFINGPIGSGKSHDARHLAGLAAIPEFDDTFYITIQEFYDGKITAAEFQQQFIEHTLELQRAAVGAAGAAGTYIFDSSIIQHLTFSRIRGLKVCKAGEASEAEIVERAFGHLHGFMIIYKDVPWCVCRQNIVRRARTYEMKCISELADIHRKFKSTFLEICEDHGIPCIVVRGATAQVLEAIRNPTIDTETMELVDRSVFDLGLAWDGGSAGFIIADTENNYDLKEAYFPPGPDQLKQPRIKFIYAQKLLLACETIWAYNSDFDVGALKLKGKVRHYDLWLMTVNYILLAPQLYKKAKKKLERTDKGNMRTTFEALSALICEQGDTHAPPHPHEARQDAVSEHFMKDYMIKTWPGGWSFDTPDQWLSGIHTHPWYLFNNYDRYCQELE